MSSSRPPDSLLLGTSESTSGITSSAQGVRVVAASRRADGSLRKEIRIRPGFTPQEDVGKYRPRQVREREQRGAPPAVPGLQQARTTGPRSQDATVAKQARDHELDLENVKQAQNEVPETWNFDGQKPGPPPPAPLPAPEPQPVPISAEEPAKRRRAIEKRLRQAKALSQKQDLLPEQQVKVDQISSLEEQLASLKL